MTYPDNPQQPHSNPYDKAYPVSPFESEPQQPQQQVQQPQQPDQWQQSQQQASWQGPPVPPQGASQSGGMGVQPAQPNTMTYGPNMQPPQQVPYTTNPYAPAPVAVDPQKKNHLGLIAMVMGLLCIPSLIFMGWWPPIIAITTLVVSIVEQNRMTGFAITGLVLSSVCIAIIIVGILIFLVFEVTDSGYDNYDSYRSYLPDNSLEDA